jgi:2-methylfumaryl-CoA hydratase
MSDASKDSNLIEPKYGRLLDDFRAGEVYHHPWEVTIDDGMLAMFAASFLDPNPLYSSRRFARDMGFRDKVVPPVVLMNLALSFSVHDVSEQTIAHLAYMNMRFPCAAYSGDTLTAYSKVIGVRASESKPDRGIVHVRTVAVNQDGATVVHFERKALIPAGRLGGRAHPASYESYNQQEPTWDKSTISTGPLASEAESIPHELAQEIKAPRWPRWVGRPRGLYEDFQQDDTLLHSAGRTVGESEHMQLAILSRNSHPLHTDELYSRKNSFARTRVVEGGLVFAWACSLASRDTTANALWELNYDRGSHPAPVFAGDTLYAVSRVIEKRDYNERAGIVRFQLVATKNETPADLISAGADLFGGKVEQKVFEIDRAVLLPKRTPVT